MHIHNFFSGRTYSLRIKIFAVIILGSIFSNTSFSNSASLRSSGMGFTENKGQVADTEGNLRPDVLYTASGNNLSVFIRQTGVSYVLNKSDNTVDGHQDKETLDNLNYYSHRVDLDFVGCNANAETIKQDEVNGVKNFYYPHCEQGVTQVKSFNTLIQKNIYNNIDIVYKGNKAEGLKYDIVVNPGGNPNDIKMKYAGADNILIENGKLIIETSLGQLIEHMPRVYQNINGKIVDVECRYEILDMRCERKNTSQYSSRKLSGLNNHILSFKLETYNPEHPLIIDPWVTYLGGSMNDYGYSITTDVFGNTIFTGATQATDFPVTSGAQQVAKAGVLWDAFVAKMDAAGVLQWATYYGGNQEEEGYGICTDKNTGDIYFTGHTRSLNFPRVPAAGQTNFINTYPGAKSAFLVKLNPAGLRLWATFYGDASGQTIGTDVTIDQNNDVILYGNTSASNNIASPGTFQSTYAGGNTLDGDAFVAKFNPTGARIWASYCGGSGVEKAGGISCDALNNIYIAGTTSSANFPVSGAHQPVFGGGADDAFLFKFDANGQRVWGTYYGGSAEEHLVARTMVEVDLNGDVYLGGGTASFNGIATPGSFQAAKSAGLFPLDAYVAKFTAAGARVWATYIGGNSADYTTGLAVDNFNNIIVAGDTYSPDFPVTACAYQTQFIGSEDQFICTFNSNGIRICSGLIGLGIAGGPNNEAEGYGGCVAVSGGFVYLVASSMGTYPATSNAHQTTANGVYDAVVAKLCIVSCGLPDIITADFTASNTNFCAGQAVNFTLQNTSCSQANTTYQWTFPGASPATSTDRHPTNIFYSTPGSYQVKVVIVTPCGNDSVIKNSYINVGSLTASIISTSSVSCNGGNDGTATVGPAGGSYTYSWSNGETTVTASSLPAGTHSVIVSDGGSCSATLTLTITEPPALGIGTPVINPVVCNGESNGMITLSPAGGTGIYIYSWSNGVTASSLNNLSAGTYSVTITDENGCTLISNMLVTEPPALTVAIVSVTSICYGQNAILSANAGGGTTSAVYAYSWNTGHNTAIINQQPTSASSYTVHVTDANGCTATTSAAITVNPLPVVSFTTSDDIEGCGPLCINFTNEIPGVQVLWDFGDGGIGSTDNIYYCYTQPGSYHVSLTITDNNGCSNTLTQNNYVTVFPTPIASFQVNPNPVMANMPVNFIDQSIGANSWSWSFGDVSNVNASTQNPQYTYTEAGTYVATLVVFNTEGCSDTITENLLVQPEFLFYIPNSFTPNGDGKNDVFIPKVAGIETEYFEFYIFDRWGNEIWYTTKTGEGWDGRANGGINLAQIDTYVWQIKIQNSIGIKKSYTGHVNLVR